MSSKFFELNKAKVNEEIVKRFQILEENFCLLPQVRFEFVTKNIICRSEGASIGPIKVGCLYWISDEENKMIEKFEKERNIKVYHLILSHTNIGEMYSLLYVSQYPEEWDMDKESLKMGQPCVCAFIKDDDYNVDFGSIVISSGSGGLIRTY